MSKRRFRQIRILAERTLKRKEQKEETFYAVRGWQRKKIL
jgi:hypothetical protein